MKNRKKLVLKVIVIISIIILTLLCLTVKSHALTLEGAIDGIVGVLLYPLKLLPILLGAIIGLIMGFFASNGNLGATTTLTLEDILFNRVELLNVNFFDFSVKPDTAAMSIRQNVAIWYTSIRNVAAIALAIIAIYVGIRMAISTVAEDKAKYKTMLIDWLSSLALLFVLQYIMIFIININNAFITVLSKGVISTGTDMIETFRNEALGLSEFTTGMGQAIAYLLLQGITFIFLLQYIKRMITIAFLIVIAPLVTITYSIDKMGDGKAQALNAWLKEFTYNILIQPFHCVSYLILGQTAFGLLQSNSSGGAGLANAVLAIVILVFIYTAEKILKTIFHFRSESMGETVANAAIVGAVLGKIGGGSKKGGSAGVVREKKNYGGGNNKDSDEQKGQNGKPPATKDSPDDGENNPPPTDNGTNPGDGDNNNPDDAGNVDQNDNQNTSGRKPAKRINRLARGAANLGRGYLGLTARLAGAITLGTLGLATGDAKAMAAGAATGFGYGSTFAQWNDTRVKKHRVAKALNDYKAQNPNLTQEELVDKALHFADGTEDAKTVEEKNLRDEMQNMQAQYTRNGLDDRKVIKQSQQLVRDIDNGLVGETSAPIRFFGNLANKVKGNNNKPPRQTPTPPPEPNEGAGPGPGDGQNP